MSSSAAETTLPLAVAVEAHEGSLAFMLSDGRTISIPLSWYPRLAEATPSERNNWRLIGRGEGVHWPDLDEDVSVDAVVRGKASGEAPASLQRWRSARRRGHG
jgi:hypothetical protein